MKVSNRSQVTQVVTERLVTHDIEMDGKKYRRTLTIKSVVPHMDDSITVSKPKIDWCQETRPSVSERISKAEANKLEAEFQLLPVTQKNGN